MNAILEISKYFFAAILFYCCIDILLELLRYGKELKEQEKLLNDLEKK